MRPAGLPKRHRKRPALHHAGHRPLRRLQVPPNRRVLRKEAGLHLLLASLSAHGGAAGLLHSGRLQLLLQMNSTAKDRPPVFIIKAWLRGSEYLGQAMTYKAEIAKRFGEAILAI